MNLQEFNAKTRNKYLNEQIEFLKCPDCGLIVLAVPDYHITFYDPSNLKKTVEYNLPRHVRCPKCKSTWYKSYLEHWHIKEATLEEVKGSGWSNEGRN